MSFSKMSNGCIPDFGGIQNLLYIVKNKLREEREKKIEEMMREGEGKKRKKEKEIIREEEIREDERKFMNEKVETTRASKELRCMKDDQCINEVIFQPSEIERICIASWNIRSISDSQTSISKLDRVAGISKQRRIDIILMQEIHESGVSFKMLRKRLKRFWWYVLEGEGRSKGVAIGLLKRRFKKEATKVISEDIQRRWITISTNINGETLLISSIYLPHKMQMETLLELTEGLNWKGTDNIIIGGDFNLDTRKKDGEALNEWTDLNDLIRLENAFPTWKGISCIDHIVIGGRMLNHHRSLDVMAGNANDHSVIVGELIHPKVPKMNFPVPRIPDSLCMSMELHDNVINIIGEYEVGMNPIKYLMRFANATRDFVTSNKKLLTKEEDINDVACLSECLRHPLPYSLPDGVANNVHVKRIIEELAKIKVGKNKKKKRWKAIIRVAICNLRKERGVEIKHIIKDKIKLRRGGGKPKFQLVNESNEEVKDPPSVEKICGDFWKGIFGRRRKFDIGTLDKLIDQHPKLSLCERERYEINKTRLDKIMKRSCNSSQGPDGTPFALFTSSYERLRKVWEDAILLMASDDGNIPEEFVNGLLILLPKKEGFVTPADFRPLSITNVIYRLLMKYWAKELIETIEPLISKHQKAMLRGRSIHQAVAKIANTYYERTANGKRSLFVQTDFQKAFDFVNRDALIHIMNRLNIPKHLINVAKYALADGKLHLLGHSDNPYIMDSVTGVKQGCPISPILYLIVVNLMINQLSKVKSIVAMGSYADDNGLILDSTRDMMKILNIIKDYEAATGAKLNMGKSTVMAIGFDKNDFPHEWGEIMLVEETKYLGLRMANNVTPQLLWRDIIRGIANVATQIKFSGVTATQKFSLINTYLISKILYISNFTIMDDKTANEIWKHIRRGIGIKASMSSQSLTSKFDSLSLFPAIIDPYWKNITTIATTPPYISKYKVIPAESPSHHRDVALRIIQKRLVENTANDRLFHILNDNASFWKWRDEIGHKHAALNLYNTMKAVETHDFPIALLKDLNIPNGLAIYYAQRNLLHASNKNKKNNFIFFMNKVAPLRSKLNFVKKEVEARCQFCGAPRQTHAHIISECMVGRWIRSNPFNSNLWPSSVKDLLCGERHLNKDEVNIRIGIINAIYRNVTHCEDWCEMEKKMSHDMKWILKDIEERSKIATIKKEGKSDRPPPPEGKYAHKMYFDGSVNPKLLNGGYGFSINDGMIEVAADCGILGNKTINEAEALALIKGLERAISLNIKELSVFGDSLTIVKLCNQRFGCPSPKLYRYYAVIQMLMNEFDEIEVFHTPREHNKRADVLAFTGCNAPEKKEQVKGNVQCNRPKNSVCRVFEYEALVPKRMGAEYLRAPHPFAQRRDKGSSYGRQKRTLGAELPIKNASKSTSVSKKGNGSSRPRRRGRGVELVSVPGKGAHSKRNSHGCGCDSPSLSEMSE
jgi:ribonuclease HI/endonuclease/exonuclease/phosphatase family metal-dependent hydrolase